MNELALFAGAGGGILGGILNGWRTICAVEIDPYARDVLVARQNDGCLPPFPIWDDIRTFDGRPWRGLVEVVSGGFPCQDISVAGKGAGIEGSRSGLWGEMARIVGEVQPRFVFVENSPMLIRRGLARVLGDLAAMGFDAQWGVVGARHAGAPHQRNRIWIVAHARSERAGNLSRTTSANQERNTGRNEQTLRQTHREDGTDRLGTTSETSSDVSHTQRIRRNTRSGCTEPTGERGAESPVGGTELSHAKVKGLEGHRHGPTITEARSGEGLTGATPGEVGAWWAAEPGMGRVADELANRLDRHDKGLRL